MASLTGQLVAETYKALLKLIDNDILTASEKQITDGFGGGSNVFIDSQGFLRANKYKITNGLATQFLKADGSLDSNAYLTSITGAQVITALGYTPVPTTRTITINGETHNLAADNSWTVGGTAAIWGNITGTLSNQTDLQNALNAKFDDPTGTISQYIRGDGSIANFPSIAGGLPTGGTTGQILAKIDATDYNAQWIDNYATQTKNEVKLGQTLAKGAAVYVSSANGTNIIVSAASNASESLSSKTFGLLETGGATNDIVKCVTFGLLAGLDTSTATAGDPVWLGVNGALIFGLANKPVAPANLVYIGVVTRVQSNNGEIFVNVQNGFEIEELHDVLIQSKVNNQGLFYESSTGLWKNKSIATVLGYTPANDASVVHNTGDETVNGRKTFTTQQTFNNSFLIKNTGSGSVPYGGWTTIYTSDSTFNVMVGTSASTSKGFSFLYGSTVPLLTLPSADGTLALVDQLSNFVSGSGSAGYIPKWTSASVIGSSLLYDDGTNIGYGTNVLNYGNYGRTFTGAGFGTASFGFESVSNSTTNNALLGGLSFVIGQNDSSRRIGAAIQAYLLASTATNYGSELRFFAKADGVFTIAEVARMTSAGLRVYGTIIKDGGTSSQFLKADGSIDSNTYLTTGSASSLYLPLTGGTLTGKLTISTSAMGAQINGGTFTQGTASSYALGVANGGGFDLTLGTSSISAVIQSWSSKPISLNPQGNNVLIGTTTDSGYKLDVNGAGRFIGQISATGGDFRMTSGPTAAIGVVLSSEYSVASNPKSIYTSFGQSTVLGGHEFRSVDGSGAGSITSAYSNPSGNWTFYYPATFSNSFSNTSDMQIIANGNISGINIRSTQGGRLSILQGYIAANVTSFLTSTGTNNPSIEAIRISNSTGASVFVSSVTANQYISNATDVGSEYYFFRGNSAVNNNLTMYSYSNNVYVNAYSSYYLRANNTGGSGGNIYLSGGNIVLGGLLDLNSNSTPTSVSDKMAIGVNGTSYGWIQTFGGRTLTLQKSGNNVGIGNGGDYAPYLLTLNVTGGGQQFGAIDNSNGNSLGFMQFNVGSLVINARGSSDSNIMQFITGGNPRITILSSGMTGINTTTPGNARLYVNGNVRMGSAVSGLVRSFYAVQVGNNITFDVFRWLDDSGTVIGTGSLCGSLYLTFYDTTTGGNQIVYEYRILSCGNGTTNASITQVGFQLRGTQPITGVQIVNDGSGGGIKVIGTVVPSGVAGCIVWGTFVGTAIG